ncbi:TetR/AcrR family transcriptional regulator [Mangrovimicrobium sediminis]|uniref:TetR/AcrR family transcriptional regulator n=1 Tax=Mangrovimicrobium sediminis TaxID=2562682 RepID=A0A4Z0LUQ0_9GAMM|nr:TetR/AcrR family transcriptional regulator [Haliea sp. SAOS-164]TGD71113.1 TetR/AcrR family transcriptional regulator [Haliea sp. SAOS-164]
MARLLESAQEEFSRAGYDGATTAAIARRAEITEAQLFRYFESKAALFRAAVFEPLNERFAAFNARQLSSGEPAEDMRAGAEQYIGELQQFIRDNAPLLQALLVAEATSAGDIQSLSDIDALGGYFDIGAAVMKRRIDGRARVAPELMVRVSFAAVLANVLFRDWLFPAGMASDARFNAAVVDFILDGINANPTAGNPQE